MTTHPHPAPAREGGTRMLAAVMHTAFFLLLTASVARYLLRHPGSPDTPWIIALGTALALLYVLGPALGAAPTLRRLVWLGLVTATWAVLVDLAPSFAWCAVPLFFTALRTLPPRAAIVLVATLTAFVVAAQLRLADEFDPNLLVAPPAVAALATAVFVHMERQAEAQRTLIDDLLRTRRELAATERREGTLAERQRLSMEIHDTLAQHLSSQQMLLQAADRVWDAEPATARTHVRTANGIAARGLAEARRLVHDLAPSELAGGADLPEALRTLDAGPGVTVRFHLEGTPVPLPDRVQSALLRVAQGALANIREHAGARTAALTLTYLGDQVVLDIADDGHGFPAADTTRPAPDTGRPGPDPARPDADPGTGPGSGSGSGSGRPDPAAAYTARPNPGSARVGPDPATGRGHGLPAMRARLGQLGGTLTVESTPGEGTVLSAAIPLEHRP